MAKHPGGRPPKLTPTQREEVYKALQEYIEVEEDPTVVGFVAWDATARKYHVTRDNLNDWAEFSTLIKEAIAKQEAYLLRGSVRGKLNAAVSIFRLKQPQHGYSDKTEQDVHHSGEVQFLNNVPRPKE